MATKKKTTKTGTKKKAVRATAKKTLAKGASGSSKKKGSKTAKKAGAKTTSKKTGAKKGSKPSPASKKAGTARPKPSSASSAKDISAKDTAKKTVGELVAVTKKKAESKKPDAAKKASSAKKKPSSGLSKKELERVREALVYKKLLLTRHLQAELSELETTDKYHLADLEEMASDTMDTDSTVGIIEIGTDTLEQIEEALRKIDDGTYGDCTDCGEGIPVERLQALPFATLCIDCKKKQEMLSR